VCPIFPHRAGGTRFCGLANVGRDPLLGLLELRLLLLPFVYLGHPNNTGRDGAEGREGMVCCRGSRRSGRKLVIGSAGISLTAAGELELAACHRCAHRRWDEAMDGKERPV
jgi:hypothetical protein